MRHHSQFPETLRLGLAFYSPSENKFLNLSKHIFLN